LPIRVKERLRDFYRTGDHEARRVLEELKIRFRRALDYTLGRAVRSSRRDSTFSFRNTFLKW
jgi:hypothetical protein